MSGPFNLTPALWEDVRRRVMARALQLTKSPEKARDLVQEAILDALDPDRHPWDPAVHVTLAEYLCGLVWSRHGNTAKSYRVTHASEPLDDAALETASPYSHTPLQLLLKAEENARAARLYAALEVRIKDDPLIRLLLADDDQDDDDPPLDEDGAFVPRPNAEAASTRRALAKGYTEQEIKNARQRLKRHAWAVRHEDEKKLP